MDTQAQASHHSPTEEAQKPASHKLFKNPNYKWPRRVFIGLILLGFIGFFIFVFSVSKGIPSLAEIENPKAKLSTQLISADGVVLQNFYAHENRINVKLNEVSPWFLKALIATEDVRFYNHSGVDHKAPFIILKTALQGKMRGASSISQQLARNLYNEKVGKSRSPVRKVKEAIVAWIMERKFTKQEILTAYLNTVNIYGDAYGLEVSAQKLYGKSARNLNLEEAALAVGLLKGQGYYHPLKHPKRAFNRRNTVIEQMGKYGFLDIPQSEVDSIKLIPLANSLTGYQEQAHIRGTAPYFREHSRRWMKKWCKKNGYDLYKDGLRVFTTIDSRMQKHAEAAVKEHFTTLQAQFNKHMKGKEPYRKEFDILERMMKNADRYKGLKKAGKSDAEIKKIFDKPVKMKLFVWTGDRDTLMSPLDSLKHYSKFLEVGMVSIDPTNGHVKVWVGGINYKYFKYDHVAKGKRQVGSTFKPFVYAAAIDNGYMPCDRILNQRVVFDTPDGPWEPKNADGKVGGIMTLRRGLATSANLMTARLLKDLDPGDRGPEIVADYARKMGIKSHIDPVPSLVLGTSDLNVMELTGAYTTFANKGVWTEPIYIKRIEDKHGNVLEDFAQETREVLDERKAYIMAKLLQGVVDEPGGTAGRLRYRYDFRNEIGGKTGTTQNHADGWFMGITPNLVSGVWVGCADRRMRFKSLALGQGANMALPIWAIYMKAVYKDEAIGLPQDPFDRPRGMNVDFDCGETPDDEGDGFEIPQKEIPKDQDDFDRF